jgi:hypothetical protein
MLELHQSLEGDDVVITQTKDKLNIPTPNIKQDKQTPKEPLEGPSSLRPSSLKTTREAYTMRQYEHSVMLNVQLWNHKNDSPEFTDLVNKYITAVDVAKASGQLLCVGRPRHLVRLGDTPGSDGCWIVLAAAASRHPLVSWLSLSSL